MKIPSKQYQIISILLILIPILIVIIWLIVEAFIVHYVFGLIIIGVISIVVGIIMMSSD